MIAPLVLTRVQVAPPEAVQLGLPLTVTETGKVNTTRCSRPTLEPVVSAPVFLRISMAGNGGSKSISKSVGVGLVSCVLRETTRVGSGGPKSTHATGPACTSSHSGV